MAAPIVLAKGYDEVAQRVKAIAAKHNITMVDNCRGKNNRIRAGAGGDIAQNYFDRRWALQACRVSDRMTKREG